ncbi:MAG: penicillin-binding transpeptidase domain-containing protein [Jatrophihabitans sp.]
MRARSLVAPLVALLVLADLSACTGSPSPQQSTADRFAAALGSHNAATAAALTDAPTVARTALAASLDGLGTGTRGTFQVFGVKSAGAKATAKFHANWKIDKKSWKYDGSFPLRKQGTKWLVHWQPNDLHPALTAGTDLAVRHDQPARAALLDSAGKPLAALTPVVRVGIEKKLVADLPKLASTLAAIPQLASTRQQIIAAVGKAQPTDFVPVITLRRPAYQQIKDKIYNLAGTVFQTDTALLGPTAHFGQPLLGKVSQPTKEIIDKSGGRITADEQTGVGGLEQALEATLAGTAGVSVVAQPQTAAGPTRVLAALSTAKPGTPVHLTLDRSVQTAAEGALAGVAKPASIVAVQRSSGRILADANTDAVTYDYGLAGAFPPGSTFKIATWAAAFTAVPSLTPQTVVACPSTTTVDGRRFENENKFVHPPIPINAAFGYSCNTSAINEALKLPDGSVGDAARLLGLGRKWTLPVNAFSGTVPAPATQTERAADVIGQGRVLASPLLLALMAGAVTSGKVNAPSIITTATQPAPTTVPATIVTKMTALMKATVDLPGGTAHDLASVGGVEGKTGTAEYGTAQPPRTHSWFAGVHGDVAFAVFVYDGATTGTTAVPIAARFLQRAP